MIIVSGKIYVTPGTRDAFIEQSLGAVKSARETSGCIDFVVAADPLESNRVNIYEAWNSESELNLFRGSGPDSDIASMIESAEVKEHRVEPNDT